MTKLFKIMSSSVKCEDTSHVGSLWRLHEIIYACLVRLKFGISFSLELVKDSKQAKSEFIIFCNSDSLETSCFMNPIQPESWPLLLSSILLTPYLITMDKERGTVTFLFYNLLWLEQALCFWTCWKQLLPEMPWSLIQVYIVTTFRYFQ